MAGLGKQFLTINNNLLPETSDFGIDYQMIENEFQTEAGTDTSIIVRAGKHIFTPSWVGATSTYKALFEGFCAAQTVTVVFDGVTYTCRARDLKEKLTKYSNRYEGSQGLWDISFTLKEI